MGDDALQFESADTIVAPGGTVRGVKGKVRKTLKNLFGPESNTKFETPLQERLYGQETGKIVVYITSVQVANPNPEPNPNPKPNPNPVPNPNPNPNPKPNSNPKQSQPPPTLSSSPSSSLPSPPSPFSHQISARALARLIEAFLSSAKVFCEYLKCCG